MRINTRFRVRTLRCKAVIWKLAVLSFIRIIEAYSSKYFNDLTLMGCELNTFTCYFMCTFNRFHDSIILVRIYRGETTISFTDYDPVPSDY